MFAQLQGNGLPPSSATIAARTGLSLREVRNARARLFRHRHLMTPSPERWRAIQRSARGTIWPQIARYAHMGMTPQEILVAVDLERGIALSYARVENALNKAWKQGLLERRTEAERRAGRADALQRRAGELRQRVAAWLELAARVAYGRMQEAPSTPTQWRAAVAAMRARPCGTGLRGHRWQLLARLCARHNTVLPANDPRLVAQLRAADLAQLTELLAEQCELLPDDELGQSYLLDLYLARRQWIETGDRQAVDAFPSFYEEVEPEIALRLAPAIRYIRDRLCPAPPRIARLTDTAMVAYADVSVD